MGSNAAGTIRKKRAKIRKKVEATRGKKKALEAAKTSK